MEMKDRLDRDLDRADPRPPVPIPDAETGGECRREPLKSYLHQSFWEVVK